MAILELSETSETKEKAEPLNISYTIGKSYRKTRFSMGVV